MDSQLQQEEWEASMDTKPFIASTAKVLAAGIGLGAAGYAAFAAVAWLRYGRTRPATGADKDDLLDRFMPNYEICGRHKIHVAATPEVALAASAETEFEQSPLIRAIFKAREWILRSAPALSNVPRGLLAQTQALGWGMLAQKQGREIVMGCVTKPWEANPVFRALPPEEFAAFHEPGYVKIAWTLKADPDGEGECTLHTETRAIATDPAARRKFRRYWALLSPGILLIRGLMLPGAKAEAERRSIQVAT